MAKPTTKKDVARWRKDYGWVIQSWSHPLLGTYIKLKSQRGGWFEHDPDSYWSYRKGENDDPIWCSKRTLEKRKLLGPPKPRSGRHRRMKDISVFSMEEIEMAQALMEGLE